jgi:PAS domain S-box-containing protein
MMRENTTGWFHLENHMNEAYISGFKKAALTVSLFVITTLVLILNQPNINTDWLHSNTLHIVLEIMSTLISLMIFAGCWTLNVHKEHNNLLIVGSFFLCASYFELLHFFTNPELQVFQQDEADNRTLFFWFCSRFSTVVGLTSFMFLYDEHEHKWFRAYLTEAVVLAVVILLTLIGVGNIDYLPELSTEGGHTSLKMVLEYIAIMMFIGVALISIAKLRGQHHYNPAYTLAIATFLLVAELLSTFYFEDSVLFSLLAHTNHIVAEVFIYVTVVVGISKQPINELEKSQQAYEHSEQHLMFYMTSLTGYLQAIDKYSIVAETDKAGRYIRVNNAFLELTGYKESDIIGREFAFLFDPKRAEAQNYDVTSHMAKGKPWSGTLLIQTAEQKKRAIQASMVATFDADGEVDRYISIGTDITDYQRQLQAEKYYQAIIENVDEAIIGINSKGEILSWNTAARHMFNYTEDEIYKQSISRICHYDSVELDMILETVFHQGKRYHNAESLCVTKAGVFLNTMASYTPIISHDGSEILVASVILQNITSNKQVEIQQEHTNMLLQDSLSELSSYLEAIDQHASVSITDIDGIITGVNERFCAISGYEERELIGQTHQVLNPNKTAHGFYEEVWAIISKGNIWRGVLQDRSKQGELYWLDTAVVPLKNDTGKIKGFITVRFNVTEQKKLLDELETLNAQ